MNKEKNKGFIIGLIRIFLVLIFEMVFIYIWIRDINILKVNPFENKGNWLIAGVYLVELTLLLKIYGGLKIGHLARWNVMLSQFLALVICNVIMAVQIILMVGDMHLIAEILYAMLLLQVVDFVVSAVMVHLFDALLLKCGSYVPSQHFITPFRTKCISYICVTNEKQFSSVSTNRI